MKKSILMVAGLLAGALSFTACSSDKNDDDPTNGNGNNTLVAGEGLVCVEQIIDGCIDIASEVGTSKIGDPYDLYTSGQKTQALYAVESWYSWHSRDDYSNNILSIRNAYYGSRDGNAASASLATLIAANNSGLDTKVRQAIETAKNAILSIPQPFRNNIDSQEALDAMDACANLEDVLNSLKSYLQNNTSVNQDSQLSPIIDNYVDVVVLPTYKDLKEKNEALYTAVQTLAASPSDANFQKACNAWLSAREPWETSEAFLFGPVDALGLDPNMDSWPLDQDEIVKILNSGNYDNLTWSDGDDDDAIEAKQGVRGFHTLEFLLFKNGNPRTLNDGNSTSASDLDYTADNAKSWGNYMVQVAYLLKSDAASLYDAWNSSYEGGDSYAKIFKEFRIN
jgi:uncharacterized iron-regulated protein